MLLDPPRKTRWPPSSSPQSVPGISSCCSRLIPPSHRRGRHSHLSSPPAPPTLLGILAGFPGLSNTRRLGVGGYRARSSRRDQGDASPREVAEESDWRVRCRTVALDVVSRGSRASVGRSLVGSSTIGGASEVTARPAKPSGSTQLGVSTPTAPPLAVWRPGRHYGGPRSSARRRGRSAADKCRGGGARPRRRAAPDSVVVAPFASSPAESEAYRGQLRSRRLSTSRPPRMFHVAAYSGWGCDHQSPQSLGPGARQAGLHSPHVARRHAPRLRLAGLMTAQRIQGPRSGSTSVQHPFDLLSARDGCVPRRSAALGRRGARLICAACVRCSRRGGEPAAALARAAAGHAVRRGPDWTGFWDLRLGGIEAVRLEAPALPGWRPRLVWEGSALASRSRWWSRVPVRDSRRY